MPLTIIKGPPNSGRTEEVRREYIELLPRRPVLIVPGNDDVVDWERRLTRERGAFLGGRIMNFKGLVEDVLSEKGQTGTAASGVQRRHLVGLAIDSAWPRISERVERQPGLIDAMLGLIDEFRNGSIGPDALDQAIIEAESDYLEQIASVYRKYLDLLDERRFEDDPGRALKATQINLHEWQGRPIFVAGFDDLTNTQLNLLERLAAETDVTIALTHELGNPAMAVTQKLLGRLEERGATIRDEKHRPAKPIDHVPLLFEIERDFGLGRRGELTPGDALTIMKASGRRGEAESVAAEIATLVSGGTDPGSIAIAVSSPATNGTGFRDLLNEYDIPVTLEGETPAAATATGQTIVSLLRSVSPGGSASDLIAYLRGPIGQDQDLVDCLESGVLQNGLSSAAEAAGLYRKLTEEAPPLWSELTASNSEDVPALIAGLAELISSGILNGSTEEVPGTGVASEIQVAIAITRACSELALIHERSVPPDEQLVAADQRPVISDRQPVTAKQRAVTTADLADALTSGAIKTWAIPTQNTVRIASPYSLRAKRFEYLFMVSLQERAFSDSDRAGPFLSLEARNTVGLPDFTDPELQELYLFYSCLSVPTKGLWLSARIADESGKAEYPSPLIAEIEALFDPARGPLRRADRPSSAITFAPDLAPSTNELVRSLATANAPARAEYSSLLDLSDAEIEVAEARIGTAVEIELATRTLAALSQDPARELISGNSTFSATAIELFLSCPYRWFIERVLQPRRFGPDPEPIARGNLVHGALAAVYGARPGRLPRPEDLDDWTGSIGSIVEEVAAGPKVNLGTDSPTHRVARRQAMEAIAAYVKRESERESPGFMPQEMEAAFGMGDTERPALKMNGWNLRGSIDRIDTSGTAGTGVGQRGIVIDYKTGKSSVKTWAQIKREKKVQLQLYLHAMKEIWGIEPTAGLYVPISSGKGAIRGVVDADFATDVADLDAQTRDREGEFGEAITQAVIEADRAVAAMMAGQIEHDPNTCPNHLNHAAVPDWIADDNGASGSAAPE